MYLRLKFTAAFAVLFIFNCHALNNRGNSRNALMNAYESSYENDECSENFEVNQNTIIRTQDSRTLGARYLNETEFASKRECMQWCCQIADCNVAVYEDKNKGSCYIFDCGSQSEFKCKFTSHNHYTSTILRVNRHSYDLGKWGFEAKHEEELNQLRVLAFGHSTMPVQLITSTPTQTTLSKSSTTATIKSVSTTTLLPKLSMKNNDLKVESGRRCSRFQFECRNTSECIAIYNACDGIPQCADGSDESVELGCPTDSKRKNLQNENTRTETFHQNLINEHKWRSTSDQHLNSAQNSIELNRKNWDKSLGPPSAAFESAVQAPAYSQQDISDNSQQVQQPYVNGHHLQQNIVKHHQSYQQKYNSDVANVGSVFNHKTPELIPSKDEYQKSSSYYHSPSSQQVFSDTYGGSNRDAFHKTNYNHVEQHRRPQPHLSSNYHSPDYDANSDYWQSEKNKQIENANAYQKPLMEGVQQNEMLEENSEQMYPQGQNNEAVINSATAHGNPYLLRTIYPPQNFPQKKPKGQHTPYLDSTIVQNARSDSLLTEAGISAFPEEITSVASISSVSNVIHSHPQMNKLEVNLEEIEVQKVEQKNESNGAIVALTLGLSVTGILLVLVGCRIRMVRRYIRRGRSPYAHDADYLVNGMYL